MADHLLLESSSRVLLEDGVSLVELESSVSTSDVPFVASVTAVYPPGLIATVDVPFVASVTRVIGTYSGEVLNDSPKAYWQLQEASGLPQDSSGNGFHMTSVDGSPAYHLEGPRSDFGIEYGVAERHIGPIPFSAVDNISLEFWFQPVSIGGIDQPFIVQASGGQLAVAQNGNKIRVIVNGITETQSAASFTNGTWYHVVVVRDAGTWKYYVNGALDTASASTRTPNAYTGFAFIGGGSTGTGVDQVLAHVAVYDHVLSAARIKVHYDATMVLRPELGIPFVASVTTVFGPTVIDPTVYPAFIASATTVYAPTLLKTLLVPFISSHTSIFDIEALWVARHGPGNGGETFHVQLAPNGTAETATLVAIMNAGDTVVELTGTAGLPASDLFCLHVDAEVILVTPLGGGFYRAVQRGMSNTLPAAHAVGATATWTDSYDLSVASVSDVAKSFVYSVDGLTYEAWLIAFDSSQAYLGASRYPTHVAEFVGVFPPASSVSKVDGAQPSASNSPEGVSDNSPAGITVPARLIDDVDIGDVVLLRYTNDEASILTLGPRSVGIQSWYGFSRRDTLNNDVTATNPNGTVVDAAVDVETLSAPLLTTTMPGTDRTYTYGPPRFSDKGWPIGVITVRHGESRVPHWVSPDWHDFSHIYTGFGDDATFAQLVINRNGLAFAGVLEESVNLPGPQDITGPNATWDDDIGFHFASAWYVGIFVGAVLFAGPGVNGEPPPSTSPLPVPTVGGGHSTDGGGTGPPVTPPPPIVPEGGSGGGIPPEPPPSPERFSVVMV